MAGESTGPGGKPGLLPVHEVFYTWQGEGAHLGRAAYFIRTFGCPVHCPWCDAAGTWHPDHVPEKIERLAPEELARRAAASGAELVVITGGEPAIHDLERLTAALARAGLPAHLETSGAFPLRGDFAWVTVSPKWQKLPLAENVRRADELKLIVEEPESIARWMRQLDGQAHAGQAIWLQPEWTQRENAAVLRAITEAVKAGWRDGKGSRLRLRAGWQLHKLYAADALDASSRPPAPLGGDPKLGY